jgi:hypothetical protein
VAAIDAVHAAAWGEMTAVRGNEIVLSRLEDSAGKTKPLDLELYRDVASVFFG